MLKEILAKLQDTDLFNDWKKLHPKTFLSHFFCPLNNNFETKSDWEIGFYDPETEKITVFVSNEIKPADDVFKKDTQVEELILDDIISFNEARKIAQKRMPELFAEIGDGFVVLQKIQKKSWNFTSITKQLKFVNLKLDATTGKEESHQEVELVHK